MHQQRHAVGRSSETKRELAAVGFHSIERIAEKTPPSSPPIQRFTGHGKVSKDGLSIDDLDGTSALLVEGAVDLRPYSGFAVAYELDRERAQLSRESVSWLLAQSHLASAGVNGEIHRQMRSVTGGRFTSKRDRRGRLTIAPSALNDLQDDVSGFVGYSELIRRQYPSAPLESLHPTIRVYRCVSTSEVGEEHVDILPSSTTWSLDFAKKWTNNRGKDNGVIFEIDVPLSHPMLVQAYPTAYPHGKDNAVNQDQAEVTLGPTRLEVGETRNDDGYRIISARAHPLGLEGVLETMEEHVRNPGGIASIERMRDAFAGFKRFFSLRKLQERYSDSFEFFVENGAKTFTSTEDETPISKDLVITNDSRAEKFVVRIDFGLRSGIITVRYESSSFDRSEPHKPSVPRARTLTFHSSQIMSVYDYLMTGQLDRSEIFESIDWPDSWYEETQTPIEPPQPKIPTSIVKMYGLSSSDSTTTRRPDTTMSPDVEAMYS